MNISVKFLGKPEIYIDSLEVEIQQKKIEALFLYILFNKSCTRDELVSMFWCDYTECGAKRNLRNSIYKLKKLIGEEIINTIGNTYVLINPDLKIDRDIDVFVTENNEEKLLKLKEFIFLDKFYINNCIEFEKWVTSIKSVYEKMFIDKLNNGLKNSIKINDLNYIEEFSCKIISVDPCNEVAYRSLMSIYVNRGSYKEAIRLYKSLEKALKNELDVEPEEETSELFKKIVKMQKIKDENQHDNSIYYERIPEVVSIKEEYRKFVSSKDYKNCILCGDIGVGKSRIISRFIESEKINDFIELEFKVQNKRIRCYAIEKIVDEFVRKYNIELPKSIYLNYSNESLRYLKIIEYVLDNTYRFNRKTVLILRNLESIDDESFDIIMSAIQVLIFKRVFIIGEYCQSFMTDYEIITKLELQSNIKLIKLLPLSEQEAVEFINAALEDKINSGIPMQDIYKYTQGNLMFLHDIIDRVNDKENLVFSLKKSALNKIREMFISFSSNEIDYLERLSVFENGVEVSTLAYISNENEIKVLDIIDKLYKRELITELEIENHLVIKIKSKLIRDIIYSNVENFKRIELHKLIANIYESKYLNNKKDYFYISELQYHFGFTNHEYEKIYYNLLYLEYKLNYCDEFFPTLKNHDQSKISFYINREDVYEEFKKYEAMLNSIDELLTSEKLYELKMRFNFLIGRTLSRDGKREKGIYYIKALIDEAQKLNRDDFLLKGYLETIYYGLKNDNKDIMAEYIAKAKRIENIDDYETEKGVLLRLEGLCNIMDKNYQKAEKLLWESIKLFDTPKLSGTNFINIAAAYAYLGYSCRNKGEYDNAQKYLLKAIDICLEKKTKKSLDLFYEDLGYVLFLKGEYAEAEKYFEKSIELYDMFGTYWLRSIGESCMALINMYRANNEKALEHFRRAEIFSRKDSVKEELEVLEMARKQLKENRVL